MIDVFLDTIRIQDKWVWVVLRSELAVLLIMLKTLQILLLTEISSLYYIDKNILHQKNFETFDQMQEKLKCILISTESKFNEK